MLEFPDTDLKQTRFYQDVFAEGEAAIILRQLQRRCGELPPLLSERVTELPRPDLEALADDLFEFQSLTDLTHWLENHSQA